jgi:hypothetical protein
MPKIMTVEIEVPSGSRPVAMFRWLNKLLEPHRMRVTKLTETDSKVTIHPPEES